MVVTQARSVEVFDAVYAEQYAPLVRLAYLTIGSRAAAEDVVQDIRRFRRHPSPGDHEVTSGPPGVSREQAHDHRG